MVSRRWQIAAVSFLLLIMAAVELLLVDRKYGVLTGGFGQSQTVDSVGERIVFLAAYLAVNGLFLLITWAILRRLSRWKNGWPPLFLLYVIGGGGFVLLLAAQYQLHSYFSDAVSFRLMASLGGGSLSDALMFAANELVVAGLVLMVAIIAVLLLYRWLLRRYPPRASSGSAALRLRRPIAGLALVAILAIFILPRSFQDSFQGLNRTLIWRGLQNAAVVATDFDGDGYGLTGQMIDEQPFDARRHPLALDIPGNGIDEDGFGGDLVLMPSPPQPALADFAGSNTNIIIVVLESARYDMVGKRVNGKVVAPNLDALAAEGSMIAPAYSHIGFTTASLKALFSGAIEPEAKSPSLFRELKSSGYGIGVFSGQPENFGGISATVGMKENSDIFVDGTTLQNLRAFSNAAQGSILIDEGHTLSAFEKAYVKPEAWARPQFLYFNFQSGHFPYDHPGVSRRITDKPLPRSEISAANAAALHETYWNALAYADERLGQLIAFLKARGEWDNTLLFVTGDHGEELFENGFLGHGHNISVEQYGTFLVSNRPGLPVGEAIGLSDYRGLIHRVLRPSSEAMAAHPVLMLVGDLETPVQIGMAERGGAITTLRLDSKEACLKELRRCAPLGSMSGEAKARLLRLIRLWGSARWQHHR